MMTKRVGTRTVLLLCAMVSAVAPAAAQRAPDAHHAPAARGMRSRSLAAGWGTAWKHGIPGWGKTTSDVRFVAFHAALGWFVAERGELFGEAALLVYSRPERTIAVGPLAIGARVHLRDRSRVLPFVSGGAGLMVTTLDVPELDRRFNGQLFYGAGVRWLRRRGPHWRVEIRNHHISNAGTAGDNLGLNAFVVVVGADWLLRR